MTVARFAQAVIAADDRVATGSRYHTGGMTAAGSCTTAIAGPEVAVGVGRRVTPEGALCPTPVLKVRPG